MPTGFKAPTPNELLFAKLSVLLNIKNVLLLTFAFVLGYMAMHILHKKMPIIIKTLSGLACASIVLYYMYITSSAIYF